MRRTRSVALGLAIAASVAAGCAGLHGEAASEAGLREAVEQRLRRADFVERRDVSIRVEEGQVTLDGTVDADYERQQAEELVRSVDGVVSVRNRLRVAPATPGIGPLDAVVE